VRFPSVTGANLERRRHTLPADLDGELNLLFVAFWQSHQALVDTWLPLAKRLEERFPRLASYELPVIQTRSRLSRWFIDSGMRAGIPDRSVRERTITLYLDKPPFLEALGIDRDDTISVLLIDRQGTVLWQVRGPLDAVKESELVSALEEHTTLSS